MFLPIRDLDNPLYRIGRPVVTIAIVAANVVLWAVLQLLPEADGVALLVSLSFKPTGVSPALAEGLPFVLDLPDPLAALASLFVQRDFWHLAGNMACLWVFGDNVEDAMGHWKFLAFYLVVGVVAAFAQGMFDLGDHAVLFGASGAVSGVIAAYVLLHPNVRLWVVVLMKFPLRISAMWVIGAWMVFQVVNLALADPTSGVGWWAHVAGILAGATLLPVLKHEDVRLFDRGPRPLPASAAAAAPVDATRVRSG